MEDGIQKKKLSLGENPFLGKYPRIDSFHERLVIRDQSITRVRYIKQAALCDVRIVTSAFASISI